MSSFSHLLPQLEGLEWVIENILKPLPFRDYGFGGETALALFYSHFPLLLLKKSPFKVIPVKFPKAFADSGGDRPVPIGQNLFLPPSVPESDRGAL